VPALPNVAKVIRVDLFQALGGDANARDRIFFAFAGAGPAVADLNTLANTIVTAWTNNVRAIQDTASSLTLVQITDLTTASGAQTQVTAAVAGTNASPRGSASLAVVIKFRIARRYRGGHPRLYLGGIPPNNLTTAQVWSAGFTAGVQTGWAGFITAIQAAPPAALGALTHVNVSYFLGFHNVTFPSGRQRAVPTLRVIPITDSVISYAVNPRPASQRRRNLQSP
jgi:hypothetical protein